VDFLPGLVAPKCKRVVLNWVNKLYVPFTFLPFILLFVYAYCQNDVETLNGTSAFCGSGSETSHKNS
jgi:hypothetical protein